jgi:SagB-type dehydrogenase family enzyme
MRPDPWLEATGFSNAEDETWETFHEASKVGRHDDFPPQASIVARMREMEESLRFDQYPAVALPAAHAPLAVSLSDAILGRVSARVMQPVDLSLESLASLLHHGYGVTRSSESSGLGRALRVAPSGGALYPLEILVHTARVDGLAAGVYHYNPLRNELRLLLAGDQTPRIAAGLVPFQSHVAFDASLVLFLTALFGRTTFKYGARGYRFALLEAGHVAQNLNLAAFGLGLGCLNLGGYFDRSIDELLGLDGLTHSTLYMLALGERLEEPAAVR